MFAEDFVKIAKCLRRICQLPLTHTHQVEIGCKWMAPRAIEIKVAFLLDSLCRDNGRRWIVQAHQMRNIHLTYKLTCVDILSKIRNSSNPFECEKETFNKLADETRFFRMRQNVNSIDLYLKCHACVHSWRETLIYKCPVFRWKRNGQKQFDWIELNPSKLLISSIDWRNHVYWIPKCINNCANCVQSIASGPQHSSHGSSSSEFVANLPSDSEINNNVNWLDWSAAPCSVLNAHHRAIHILSNWRWRRRQNPRTCVISLPFIVAVVLWCFN